CSSRACRCRCCAGPCSSWTGAARSATPSTSRRSLTTPTTTRRSTRSRPWRGDENPGSHKLPACGAHQNPQAGRYGLALLLLEAGSDLVEHPLLVGELACLQLGVDQVPVHLDLETAAAGGDQLQVLDLLLVGAEQLGRQTDGLRLVVSHRAVLELHAPRSCPRFPP